MALSAAATSAIAQAATTAASVGASFGGSYTSAKKSYKYYQKAFNLENERQDYLLANQQQIAKNALRRAGYSTADPNGTGVTPAQISSMEGATVQSPDVSAIAKAGPGYAQMMDMFANADLAKAQADYVRKQSSRYDEYTDTQIAELRQRMTTEESQGQLNFEQAESIRQMLPVLKEKGNQEVERIRNECLVLKKQEQELAEKIKQIHADISLKKSQEAANYSQAKLNSQLTEESEAREGLIKEQTNTQREQTGVVHQQRLRTEEEVKQARFDAIWKEFELQGRLHGFDINDPISKQIFTHACWELANAKGDNAVKRTLKHTLGNLGFACDWLLSSAGGLVTGVIAGSIASGSRGSRGKAQYQAPRTSTSTSPSPEMWY